MLHPRPVLWSSAIPHSRSLLVRDNNTNGDVRRQQQHRWQRPATRSTRDQCLPSRPARKRRLSSPSTAATCAREAVTMALVSDKDGIRDRQKQIADGMTLEVHTINLLLETRGGARCQGGST
ncbi:hypothetical protein Dimus_038895 [Dionaea muscipula]